MMLNYTMKIQSQQEGGLLTGNLKMNVNLQCAMRCNKMRSGEYEKYRSALRTKYGDEVPGKLEKLAQETTYYKFSKPELLEIIHDAKESIRYYAEDYINRIYREEAKV